MKLFTTLLFTAFLPCLGLSGCAYNGQNYNDPIVRLRNASLYTVADYYQDVKSYLQSNTEDDVMEKAKTATASILKDPDSAKFRNVRIVRYLEGKVVCGEVNGKNSYGGYAGFTPFVASQNASTLFHTDSKYPEVQEASNAGITAACR